MTEPRDKTAKRKRTEEALRESEERYRDLLENANDLIQSVTPEGSLIYVNRAWRETLGYSEEEIPGLSLMDIIHPDSKAHCAETFQRVMAGGDIERVEAMFVAKDGRTITVEGSVNCSFKDGKPVATRGIFRAITQHKQAEEALRIKDRAIASSTNAIAIADPEGNLTYVNASFLSLWGYVEQEVLGKPATGFWTMEERASEVVQELRWEGSWIGELVARKKDGSLFYVQLSASMVTNEAGEPVCIMGSFVDITERRQALQALRNQTHDLGERVKELNCLYGISNLVHRPDLSLEEILQETVDLIPPGWQYPEVTCARITLEGQEFRTENFSETVWRQTSDIIVNGERSGAVEVCYLEERRESDEGSFLPEKGDLINAIAERLGRVIERRQAEEALRESEERFRTLASSAPIGIMLVDGEKGVVYCNERFLSIFGSSWENVMGFGWVKSLHPAEREAFLDERSKAMAEGREFIREFRLVTPQGETRWLSVHTTPLLSQEGASNTRVGTIEDISERRRAEQALRESEERLRNVLDVSRDLIYRLNLQTHTYEYVSPSVLRLVGFAPQEIIAMGLEGVRERFHPEDRDRFGTHLSRLPDDTLEGHEAPTVEYRWKCRDGEYRWLSDNRAFVLDEGGKALTLVGTVRDVTEDKQVEEALRESEARYKALFAGAPQGMLVADLQTKQFRHVNPAMCRMFGYTEEEFLRLGVADIHPKESLSYVLAEFEAQARGEKLLSADLPCQRKDASLFYANVNTTMVVLDGRRCNVGFFTDATERKKAEETLRESEERFRLAINATEDGLWEWDIQTNQEFFSPRWCEIIGYSFDDPELPHTYTSWVSRIHPDDYDRVVSAMNNHLEKGTRYDVDYRHRHKSGEYRWQNSKGQAVLGESGKPVKMVGCISDITQRKQAEEEIANRLKMESAIAQASTLLAGPEDADAGLDLALRILGEAFVADRAHIFLFRDDNTRMDCTGEWCAPGEEPQIDNLQDLDCAAIPWWMGKLAQNDPIIMTDTSAAPPDAVGAKKSWKALNIRSLLAVPLLSEGKLIGYVRFANMESASNEREEDTRLLRLASESIASFIQRQRAGEDKRKAYESIIFLLATAAEARDPYTEDHLPRIRGFAEAMAAELGLPPGEIREIGLSSLLHDLGKMRVPDSILIKPGPLSQAEWKIMRQHPAWGEELLSTHPWMGTARQIARWHHENWDGTGYPDGLRGEKIPLCAAIVAVADGFDAMTSDRPYKKAWPSGRAIREIRAQKGRQYSPDVVEAFNRALRKGEIGRITSADSACLPEMSEAA
jgi:PAS domain S-box-containing protein